MNQLRETVRRIVNPSLDRDDWIRERLAQIPDGISLLDVGAGSQRYRPDCSHLRYLAVDMAEFEGDARQSNASSMASYSYESLDMITDAAVLAIKSDSVDVVLSTEVLEHVPDAVAVLGEMSRALKPGGTLICTVPSHSLRHMDPYFFTPGFSDRFFEHHLPALGFCEIDIIPQGNYHRWLFNELIREARLNRLAAPFLLPSIFYMWRQLRRSNDRAEASMVLGYWIVATKANR